MWFKRILIRILGFNFIVTQDGAVFMARDERALNCAVRDYVDLLDTGGTEVDCDDLSPRGKQCYPGILHAQTKKGKCLICK